MNELEKLLRDERVNNRMIQYVLRDSDAKVVELALLRMDNESRERILKSVSKNARRYLEDSLKEMEDIDDIDEEKISYAQSLLVNLVKKYLQKGDVEEIPAPPKELPQINIDNEKEIIKTLTFLASYTKRYGLLSLEKIETEKFNPVFQKGLELIVDGWDPFDVQKLLENYKKSYLNSVEKQLDMIIEGVLGIQQGDDPRFIEEKLKSYL